MTVPNSIKHLVEKFDHLMHLGKINSYNEAQTRTDYIDSLFEALNWDIRNKEGYSPSYREVVTEDIIKSSEESLKRPDYTFRIGGVRKFFVEAKKPTINIAKDEKSVLQIRKYGWNAKLPISIITNFKEFAVYDTRIKPLHDDKPSNSIIMHYTFDEYIDKWDEIAGVFSKDAILKGSFDHFVEKRPKKGVIPVDEEFLKDIEKWRELLAKNIISNNHSIAEKDLNYAVQMIIDRLIFLRICEDRKIEDENRLLNTSKNKDIYQKLVRNVFREADDKYNSGLFHFKLEKGRANYQDSITPNLKIDDKPLKEIIASMYYPCPYEFSALPPEILGNIYERFLGQVITVSSTGKSVKIEQKPEVKKAGGVYYTPSYIVDYIIKNTIGELLKDKTPEQVSMIRVLDPACGSGSFLLGAYQFLLNWHLDYYVNHPKKYKDKFYKIGDSNYKLTISERKKILTNNIYGVDIDSQAVEVSKLSLLIKVLENETQETVGEQLKLFKERALPDLGDNIKCGNSLVGTDFYSKYPNQSEEEKTRVNPFDWQSEFPLVFKDGGFDAVVGNPPYARIQTLQEMFGSSVAYFKSEYMSADKNFDIYILFNEKGFSLLKSKGYLGFIQPHKFFQSEMGQKLRNYLASNKALHKIVSFGSAQIFDGATTYTAITILKKAFNKKFDYAILESDIALNIKNDKTLNKNFISLNQPEVDNNWHFLSNDKQKVLDTISKLPLRLKDVTRKIFVGLQTSADKIYVLELIKQSKHTSTCYSKSLDKEIEIENDLIKPFLMGKDVKRYSKPSPKNVVIFPYLLENGKANLMSQDYLKANYPLGWQYLLENKDELEKRENSRMKHENFYAYIYPKNLVEFATPKIMTPEIANSPNLTFDADGTMYHTTTVYTISITDSMGSKLFYLGLLNSSILKFFIAQTAHTLRGGYFRFQNRYLEAFPIPKLDLSKKPDKAIHDKLSSLAENMLELNKKLLSTNNPNDKTKIQRQIEATDKEINAIVYKLYGLTDEEIRIVEDSVRK
ncbi:Eco57I restriction-modification methylase domain-containing protein [Rickettsiales endosymbiont of Stachyamoeba lipophora]|uniref:Eco57I restriction-modification methylase domain-containing protein n=1 Tax=Rickettsiales endosymbiont of Stachyamoeba lipophora TaxID=2486578 RepID=UPI000F64CE26|nr:N-6 DNA methylase [Rickettsiales endosymbiont of Stachyamoeba lipophora]AZL15903.1 restriction endonuclease subunit M [Rickettsiales endosymbiont of Stachyamoeba lipophora]